MLTLAKCKVLLLGLGLRQKPVQRCCCPCPCPVSAFKESCSSVHKQQLLVHLISKHAGALKQTLFLTYLTRNIGLVRVRTCSSVFKRLPHAPY